MSWKIVSVIMMSLLVLSTLTLAFRIQPVKAQPTTIIVPNDYPTIQEAINHAYNGDTIFVKNGIYYENVVVNRSITLSGENPETTVIDGSGMGDVVDVTADNATVMGFKTKNSGANGVALVTVKNCNVTDNELDNVSTGVLITVNQYGTSSSSNSIVGNNITNSGTAIELWVNEHFSEGCFNNSIRGNRMANCTCGISGVDSNDNSFTENSISADSGITLLGCQSNIVSRNSVEGGISLSYTWYPMSFFVSSCYNTVSDNSITKSTKGIWLCYYADDNSIVGNNITGNVHGVWLTGSRGNSISGNSIMANSGVGIAFEWMVNVYGPGNLTSDGNTVSDNNVAGNAVGVCLNSSSSNIIAGNNITANANDGIYSDFGSHNNVNGNKITGNHDGIVFISSSNSILLNNNIANNSEYGLCLSTFGNNTVVGNNITGNQIAGICFNSSAPSNGNLFYHNNFLNNTQQVANGEISTNVWDNGYPSGGNYWSDYLQKYHNASQVDNSGIWNTPYTIDANNTDRYPLMFQCTTFITVKSEYSGYFVQNFHLNNVFGVYTELDGKNPVNVYGNLTDIDGSRNVTFSNVADPSGAYLSEPVDMYNLSLNANLQVFAVYPDGKSLNESYPITVIPTPSWLVSILDQHALITVEPQKQGQWDNTYEIHVEKELDLSGIFNITIPLPKFAGGGKYTLLPSVEFGFSFYSNGTCEISSSGIGELAPIQFGVGSVTAHINVTVTGEIALENGSITWVSASFSLDVGASASANFPIAGYTFDLPILGKVTIGLSATVTFDADFGATIVLAPTQNSSEELISGIGIMIQSITGKISFDAGIAVNAGLAVASITGGGDIEVNVYLQATQPYIYKFNVIGTVSIDYHVLFWSGTLWSETATLYHWPEGADGDPDPTNFTVTARYYNTSDYEEFTWTNGSLAGTAIHNIYPLTRISAASSGDNAYILYTDDNVSVPVQSGLCWTGLEFNSSQRTLRSLSLPAISDEIFFSPVVISLSNGSLLAMWDSIPFSEANSASGPLDINTVIAQYSCFDTNTQSWGPIENLATSGVTTSYLLSSDSAGCYALVLQGDSLFSNNQSLIEYDLESGSELLSMNTTNASNIASFDCVSRLAVLQMLDGSYELLNLSSLQLINLPSMEGCQVKIVQLATDSTDSIGVLYSNASSDILSIYNVSSGTISFSMNVSQSTSSLTLTQVESGYQLVTADSSGITNYLIEDQGVEQNAFYPMENITSMGSTITDKGILVYAAQNYGNYSYPLLNLTLVFIPYTPRALTISPASSILFADDSQLFTSTVSGGILTYTCQWYLNGAAVQDATSSSWSFTPTSTSPYTVYAKVTDSVGGQTTSNNALVQIIILEGPYYTQWGMEYWIIKFPGEHSIRFVSDILDSWTN